MIRVVLALALALVVAGPARAESAAPTDASSFRPTTLHAMREFGEAPLVVDVRTAAEYAAGHVPGAIHVPLDEVARRAAELRSDRGTVLYCTAGGPRSRQGQEALLAAGDDKVFQLEGGFAAWQAAGLPVETGASPPAPAKR